MFEKLLEEEYSKMDLEGMCLSELYEAFDDDFESMRIELELTEEDMEEIKESYVRRVTSDGTISKIKNRTTRKMQAGRTTGMSKAARSLRARKAARTRKANPASIKLANRRRTKAMRRRKQMGIS